MKQWVVKNVGKDYDLEKTLNDLTAQGYEIFDITATRATNFGIEDSCNGL